MRTKKYVICVKLLFCLILLNSVALSQSREKSNFQAKLSWEIRSNINRLPNVAKDEDHRYNLTLHADRLWQINENRSFSFFYDLRHYRYKDFKQFTRYDQAFNAVFRQYNFKNMKLTISDEFKLRLHEKNDSFNYTKNIFDLNLIKEISPKKDLVFGYQNWFKSYTSNDSLIRYISNRLSVKLNHEFSTNLNLGTKVEYQRHKGNLYAGSTAFRDTLNLTGNRVLLRFSLDNVFSRKLITSASYKFEYDHADDHDIVRVRQGTDDVDSEEYVAEDSDFGYKKNQGSVSFLYKANPKISFFFFYLAYRKNFTYWRDVVTGKKRNDTVMFLAPKLRWKLSSRFDIDLRYNLETNRNNLETNRINPITNESNPDYEYTIHSVAVGLNFSR